MKQREYNGFKQIFDNWLKVNHVKGFTPFLNHHAKVDGHLRSGATVVDLPFEYKIRNGKFQSHWPHTYLEKQKQESLSIAADTMGCVSHFYIVEYEDSIFIFDTGKNPPLDSSYYEKWLPSDNDGSGQWEFKAVTNLRFENADFIISKKDWKRKTTDELLYFMDVIESEARKLLGEG